VTDENLTPATDDKSLRDAFDAAFVPDHTTDFWKRVEAEALSDATVEATEEPVALSQRRESANERNSPWFGRAFVGFAAGLLVLAGVFAFATPKETSPVELDVAGQPLVQREDSARERPGVRESAPTLGSQERTAEDAGAPVADQSLSDPGVFTVRRRADRLGAWQWFTPSNQRGRYHSDSCR